MGITSLLAQRLHSAQSLGSLAPQFVADDLRRSTEQNARTVDACRLFPLHFAREVLGVQLWSKQEEVLDALRDHRRVAVKAGNGLGKGFTAAVAVLWFLSTHAPATVLTTAPTARQVRHVLWREIRRLHRAAPYLVGGHMLQTRLDLDEDRFALGLSTDDVDQFQGFHSPNMLIVVDEAEGVEEEIYEAIDAVMTAGTSKLLLIGNPTSDSGAFRRAFHENRPIFHNITISALDSPNVQEQRVIIPGLTTHDWIAERTALWGTDSPMYQARVLGLFSDRPQDALIALSKIESAIARWNALQHPSLSVHPERSEPDTLPHLPTPEAHPSPSLSVHPERSEAGSLPDLPRSEVSPSREVEGRTERDDEPVPTVLAPTVLAVDVARFGTDQSVLLLANSDTVLHIEAYRGLDTMELAGRVGNAYRRWQPRKIVIDEIGVGAGVVDRLKELNFPVVGINVARPARQRRLFANLRAEGYWRLYELFTQEAIAIPNDPELTAQLASLRHRYNSKSQFYMESKDEARTRGVPSPDKADALMLAYLGHNPTVRLHT